MISRVEAGSSAAEMHDIDLSAVAADAIELYEPLFEDAGVELSTGIEPDVHVSGNRELVGQALANLIDNAMKYASDAHDARIRIRLAKEAGSAVLSVEDRGPGIPPDRYDDVVKRFVRLDESRSKPGTGLGLSLVKAVMALHGGHLVLQDACDDESARGLKASMIFPLEKPEHPR